MDALFPRLKKDLEIQPFDEATSENRFILSIDSKHYVINEALKELIAKAQNITTEQELSAEELDTMSTALRDNLPESAFDGAISEKARPPFVISFKLIPQHWLARITNISQFLLNKFFMASFITVFAVLHFLVIEQFSPSQAKSLNVSDGITFLLLFIVSFIVHEIGHASACRYFGQKHGAIGFGIYFIFPAFYADVTNAWKLNRKQRAIIDLSGLYFQSIFLIVIDIMLLNTNSSILIYLTFATSLTMLHTLNPFFKFDGYWLLSDLSGIANLHEQTRYTIFVYSRKLFGKGTESPSPASSVVTLYTVLLLLFSFFMVFLLSKALSSFLPVLPLQWEQWHTGIASSQSVDDFFVQVAIAVKGLFFPMLMLIGVFFYGVKMYVSFLLNQSKTSIK